jgi:nitrate reductase gamma subunit
MYEFVRGPLVWIAFIGFILGVLFKVASMAIGARKEGTVYPTMDSRYGARSIAHWIIPFGSRNMRLHPVMTVVSFLFHLSLIATPLLVMGHAVLWEQSWGVSWWSLPPAVADALTLIVVFGGLFFMLRRITAPEVRNVSALSDFLLVLLVISPFLTGFLAHMQWLHYEAMVTLHIVTGAVWLIAIPFTRLSHALWFLFSRAYMGSEFGRVRNARDW